MATSQDILNEINNYKNPGAIKNQIEQTIKDAYAPNVKNLIDEGNKYRNDAYGAFFNSANSMGHSAADASPASQLSTMVNSANQAYNPYAQNLGLRDYYKTSINDMVGKGTDIFNSGLASLKDQYAMLFQQEQAQLAKEQADRAYELQKQQLAASRAAANAQADYYKSLGSGLSVIDDNPTPTAPAGATSNQNNPTIPIMDSSGQLDYGLMLKNGWKEVGNNGLGSAYMRAPDGGRTVVVFKKSVPINQIPKGGGGGGGF